MLLYFFDQIDSFKISKFLYCLIMGDPFGENHGEVKSDSFLHDRIRLAQMRFIKSGVNGADMPDKSAEVLDGINFNVKVDGMGLFVKMVFHLWEQSEAGENYDGGDYRAGIKSDSESQSKAGRSPKPRGGRESFYLVPSGEVLYGRVCSFSCDRSGVCAYLPVHYPFHTI